MKLFIGLAAMFLIAISLSRAQAQSSATPETVVRNFYAWYLHKLNQNEDPLEKRAEMRKYVTQRLMKSLNRALAREEGINADFFLDAQDWDESWEKNIVTSKAKTQGERATVSVTLKGGPVFGSKKLNIGLRKEAGQWKIDSVNGRANP